MPNNEWTLRCGVTPADSKCRTFSIASSAGCHIRCYALGTGACGASTCRARRRVCEQSREAAAHLKVQTNRPGAVEHSAGPNPSHEWTMAKAAEKHIPIVPLDAQRADLSEVYRHVFSLGRTS